MGKSPHQDKNSFWWEIVVKAGINITGNSCVAFDNNFLEKISPLFEVSALPVEQTAYFLPTVLPVCSPMRFSVVTPCIITVTLSTWLQDWIKVLWRQHINLGLCHGNSYLTVKWDHFKDTLSSFSLFLCAQITAWAAFPLNTTCSPFVAV